MFGAEHLLALDQGTSSSRAIVFHRSGRIVAMAQREFRQIYPQPGWVEHDPIELWTTQRATAREALAASGLAARDIATIVGGFSTAVALARASDLVASVPERHTGSLRAGMFTFVLPVSTPEFTVSLLWHPR